MHALLEALSNQPNLGLAACLMGVLFAVCGLGFWAVIDAGRAARQ